MPSRSESSVILSPRRTAENIDRTRSIDRRSPFDVRLEGSAPIHGKFMKTTSLNPIRRSHRGVSLLELMVTVAIIFTVAALAVPRIMTQVYAVRILYSASDLSGLLQRARMEAVRKNTFYSLQRVAGNPVTVRIIDRNGTAVNGIPPIVLGNGVDVTYGSGSGAPGETAFIASLNFPTGAAAGTTVPSFSSRGLPCPAAANACVPVAGQGFVFFISGTSAAGAVGWTAIAVTPSGRCELFSYSGTNWSQQ
jgi:type II secretory pathway pseudopilin PulG